MNHAHFCTTEGQALLLESVKAEGRVVARMLDMRLEQRYRNPLPRNVEVVYTFPLPWHAVLLGMEVEINGETLTAQVQAKATARTEYEQALCEGDTGILLSVNRDRSYTLELGNLMGGESCVVRLHYVQILQPEQGSLRLMLPTTLAPRYGDPVRDAGYEPHAVPAVSASVEYPFDIRLTLQGELVHATIGSPSHSVSLRSLPAVDMRESHVVEVHLAAQAWLDRDFVLLFQNLSHDSMGLAAWDRLDPQLGVVMAHFTPRLPTRQSLPLAMKVLVDCSGSMEGDSIQAARSALQIMCDSLQPNDRFSLSRFGDTVEHRSKALWTATPAALAAARRWSQQLEADLGGTEMNDAIVSTLVLPGAARSDLLLITDGDIHAIDAVIESAQQSGHRFFVVGIGSGVAEGLLRRLAEETGGSCEFVAPGEPAHQVESAILRLYHRMRSPLVRDARIEWPEGCPVHAASDLPLSVFDGDDITVFALLHAEQAQALTQPVRLYGRLQDVEGEVLLAELTPAFMADEANTLARLAAHQRYWQLRRGAEGIPAVLTKQLPALAQKYQLVTDDTALLLVKQRAGADQATDMPERQQVHGMLVAGWGGQGSVNTSVKANSSAADQGGVSFCRKLVDPNRSGLYSSRRNAPRVLQSRSSKSTSGKSRGDLLRAFIDSMGDDDTSGNELAKHTPDTTQSVQRWKQPPSRDAFWAVELELPKNGVVVYEGLTPAGLTHALKINPSHIWPLSCAGLHHIGLGARVIEWLELVIGAGEEEATTVQMFLKVMSQYDFGPWASVERLLGRWLGGAEAALTPQQQVLRERILNDLAGVKAEHWPAAVLDFAEGITAYQ